MTAAVADVFRQAWVEENPTVQGPGTGDGISYGMKYGLYMCNTIDITLTGWWFHFFSIEWEKYSHLTNIFQRG